jgi:hypothetical protein
MVVPWSCAFGLWQVIVKKLFYEFYDYSVFSTLVENCTNLYARTVWDETSHTRYRAETRDIQNRYSFKYAFNTIRCYSNEYRFWISQDSVHFFAIVLLDHS